EKIFRLLCKHFGLNPLSSILELEKEFHKALISLLEKDLAKKAGDNFAIISMYLYLYVWKRPKEEKEHANVLPHKDVLFVGQGHDSLEEMPSNSAYLSFDSTVGKKTINLRGSAPVLCVFASEDK
ncbi:MAG: hypothetical protein V4591_06435, partial [Bdellovibrionota bacterium]